MTGGAVIEGPYRYNLTRMWDPDAPVAVFVMLNPSTADADTPDPTVTRCIAHAKRWGCGTLVVVNLVAWRATRPADLFKTWRERGRVIQGPENPRHVAAAIQTVRERGGHLVFAWGGHAARLGWYVDRVRELVPDDVVPECLGTTKHGHPIHPLARVKQGDLAPWSPT